MIYINTLIFIIISLFLTIIYYHYSWKKSYDRLNDDYKFYRELFFKSIKKEESLPDSKE